MRFIEHRYIFYFISLILTLFGGLSFYIFNPHLGIDLVGGEILEVQTKANVPYLIEKLKISAIYFPEKNGYLIKGQNLNILWKEIVKEDSQAKKLKFESISSSLSAELKNKAILMIILVSIAIGTYTSFAFYQLRKYFNLTILAIIVIISILHDVIISAGFYILFSKFFNFDLDIKFITALLIIAGFSIHDTIIILDRLRENLIKTQQKTAEIFNSSIKQTLRRSIFTSLTAVLSILPFTILISDLRGFLLAIQLGIITGTYSSICLVLPLLYDSSSK